MATPRKKGKRKGNKVKTLAGRPVSAHQARNVRGGHECLVFYLGGIPATKKS